MDQSPTATQPVAGFEVERPRLVGEIVLDQIRKAIIDKRLAPGSRLSEASLAEMLSVSKTPVREALLQLRTIGLVTAKGGSLRVTLPSPALVKNAYEVRAGLESLTARLAASRADDGDTDKILMCAKESEDRARGDDIAGFRQYDREFHQLVAIASKNQLASTQVMNARDLCQALRQRDVMTDQVSRACGQAHIAIAEAIMSRNHVAAGSLMYDHIMYVMDRVLASMTTAG